MARLIGTPDYFIGTLKIRKLGSRGLTESYIVPGNTYDLARAAFASFLSWRAVMLGANCEIRRAVVSNSNAVRESDLPTGYTYRPFVLGVETEVEPVNKIEDCWNIRLETSTGQGVTRQIRALRDSWIGDDDVLSTFLGITLPGAGTYGNPTAPLTALNAVKGFLAALRDYTQGLVQDVTPPVPPATVGTVTNTFLTWTDIVIIDTGKRDTGRDPTATVGRRFHALA